MDTFDSFAKEIAFNKQVLDNYITFADKYYHSYYINKKRTGAKREIDSPSKELKSIQRWVLINYFNKIPVSNRANGFVKGRGIKRNAKFHLNKSYILTIDIENFFPSITQEMVYKSLKHYFIDNVLTLKLAKLCTYKRRLPQGAPTSPILSNIVFNEIDDEIKNYCNVRLVTYSRYADDLVFSSNTKNTLVEIYNFVNRLLNKHSFKINKSKTKYLSGKGRMAITGININSGKLTVNKEIKRNLRSNLHNIIIKKDETINKNSVLGYLSYIKDIEPDYYIKTKEYINKLKNTSKTSCINVINVTQDINDTF